MRQFFKAAVAMYLKLTGEKETVLERRAPTPYLSEDDEKDAEDLENMVEGKLKGIAAKVIMKILYGARMARYDLLHPCQELACRMTKWTPNCDKRLLRIICYIHQHPDLCMYGWVGDHQKDLRLWLYTDADVAADTTAS